MKTVWKFGTRWDETGRAGTSIFKEIFLKYGVAFANSEPKIMEMREGDLIAFSDGYEIIAVGRAISPPAKMTKFNVGDIDARASDFLEDGSNNGCRVEIFPFNDGDNFQYKARRRFHEAIQISQKINELYQSYSTARLGMRRGALNIFYWANKELAQDSFLCWLLAWAKYEGQSLNPVLHRIAQSFIRALLEKFDITSDTVQLVTVRKQYNNIDLIATVEAGERKYLLLYRRQGGRIRT